MNEEDLARVRQQRAQAFAKKLEEQKREEQLKKQEVIDFRQTSAQNGETTLTTNVQSQPMIGSSVISKDPPVSTIKQEIVQQPSIQKQIVQAQEMKTQPTQQKEEVKNAQQPQKQGITKEQRVHKFLSEVFLITNESNSSQVGKNLTFLYEYCGEGKLFKMEDLDDIFMSRLQKNKDENKFIYLIQCFRRLEGHLYVKEKIIENVQDIKDQIVSYFNTCLQYPETFNLPNNPSVQLDREAGGLGSQQDMLMMMFGGGAGGGPEKLYSNMEFEFTQMQNHLWDAFEREAIVSHTEFMKMLVDIVKDDQEQALLLFATLFNKMHLNLNSIKIDKFRVAESQLEMLKLLFEFKEAQEIFTNSNQFYKEGLNGRSIQMETYMGRYLSYSSLAHETRGFKDQYFKGIAKSQQSGVQRMMDAVADQLHNLHKSVFEIMQKLLKNKNCKDRVLKWLRTAISSNQEKQKMFTQAPVASDGFMLNLIDILLMFCKPFTSKFNDYHQQFPKINTFYLMNDQHVMGASKWEKIDQDAVSMFQSNQLHHVVFTGVTQEANQTSSLDQNAGDNLWDTPQPNFITECFFLAHLAIAIMESKIEKQYEQLGREIHKAAKVKDIQSYEEYMGLKLCIDAHLTGKVTLANFRSLLTFSGALFIAMSRYQNYESKAQLFDNIEEFQSQILRNDALQLQPMPLDLALMPVCIIQNLASLPKIFRQTFPESYLGKDVDLHMQVATNVNVILNKSVKNPHTRAEMIKFLAFLVPQSVINNDQSQRNQRQDREDNMYKDIFFQNYSLRHLLIEAIVNVYIDAERTGYYEKASFRFYASMIMEFVWSDKVYRDRFVQLGQERKGLFLEFCNFVINDVNNLLFEGLLELEEIRSYEEISQSPDWHQLDQEQRDQMKAKFEENQKKATAHFQLSNMVVKLLNKITFYIQEPFVSEELGERFANALNFCIDSLVSQKGLKLKVNNPERFNFDPRGLLVNILSMYANMSDEEVFLRHVVNDTRSYKDETFEKAVRILNNPKKGVQLDQSSLQRFEKMVERLKTLRSEIDREEGMYDDAPEEFLDPIMSTLMKDPVELPSSNTIIDYMTIKKHLMNDPHDPFNRSPLALEQLIPRPDIKARIEEYKEKKRQSTIYT